MKQLIAWLDSANTRTFNGLKWLLSALSAALTSAFVLSLHAQL